MGEIKLEITELHEDLQRWIRETGHRDEVSEVGGVNGHQSTYYIRFGLGHMPFMLSDHMDRFPKAWRLFSVYTDSGDSTREYSVTFLFQLRAGRRRGQVLPERIEA